MKLLLLYTIGVPYPGRAGFDRLHYALFISSKDMVTIPLVRLAILIIAIRISEVLTFYMFQLHIFN